MPRMQVLSPIELRAFETPPMLSAAQRKAIFDLPVAFQAESVELRDPTHQIGFWVNAGYYRSVRRCFEPGDFHSRDVAHVALRLGHDPSLFDPNRYPKRSQQRHHRRIERLSGFHAFKDDHEAGLVGFIEWQVAGHDSPKVIFHASIEKLVNEKITPPGYHRLQQLILDAISRFKAQQAAVIETELSLELRSELDGLLEETESPTGERRYRLTMLKRHSQSVRPQAVKARLANHAELSRLYSRLQSVVTALNWDQNGVRANAMAVIKSDIHDLRRRRPADRYLHLIAFVAHQ